MKSNKETFNKLMDDMALRQYILQLKRQQHLIDNFLSLTKNEKYELKDLTLAIRAYEQKEFYQK